MISKQPKVRKPKESKKIAHPKDSSVLVSDLSDIMFNPSNEPWRKRFINRMIEWAKKPSSVDLMEFCEELDLNRGKFYQWLKDYEDIAAAYEHMKLIFASHRRRGAIFNRMNGVWAHRGIEFYDDEEMRTTLLAAEIKAKIAQAGVSEPTNFVINYTKPRIVSPEELKETVDATI